MSHRSLATKLSIDENTMPHFMRMPLVIRMTGLGRSTIYRMIAAKEFPGPVKLGKRAVAWRRLDLERWSADRLPSLH
jgi:prophage regulatory protein